MRARGHLVLFVRAPKLGAVKRRLAAGIGAGPALAFYRTALGQAVRRLAPDPRWRLWLSVTPDQERTAMQARAFGLRGGFQVCSQGGGDLGARMGRVLRALPPGPVVIVGSDIPALEGRHAAAAFRALGTHDVVFGPAADGGYWLVGARGAARRSALFRDVRWSTAAALADTRANVPAGRRVALLETLEDVDDAAAYARWRAARKAG